MKMGTPDETYLRNRGCRYPLVAGEAAALEHERGEVEPPPGWRRLPDLIAANPLPWEKKLSGLSNDLPVTTLTGLGEQCLVSAVRASVRVAPLQNKRSEICYTGVDQILTKMHRG